jgi:hypothetical protein
MDGDLEGNGLGLIEVPPGIYVDRLKETTEMFIQDSWCPG